MPNKELAVVVGATGAFGKAIVSRLKSNGLDIIAVARSANALEALVEEHGVIPCVADISSNESIEQINAAISKPVRMVVHAPSASLYAWWCMPPACRWRVVF
jgi:NADP-dependent 3-hydroxy acid dehydrogenase YdfG